MERKILVGADDSSYFSNILHYLCKQFVGQPEIRFHLFSIVPFNVATSGREWLNDQELLNIVGPATRKRFWARKHNLSASAALFVKCGFAEDQISKEVRFSKMGIAADLLYEAEIGKYEALVTGKKDLGTLEKMLAGSISAEILRTNHNLPVWIINGKSESQKFLVPVDCSPYTLDAVDHLAFLLKDNPGADITLFHSCSLLSSEKIVPKEEFYEKWGRQWCDEFLKGEESEGGHFHFQAPEQILREAGFPMDRVHRLKSESGIEPAQMIVHHIKQESFGTIVMGRRGKDISKGIFRGVSDRVLANVDDVAIWIVG